MEIKQFCDVSHTKIHRGVFISIYQYWDPHLKHPPAESTHLGGSYTEGTPTPHCIRDLVHKKGLEHTLSLSHSLLQIILYKVWGKKPMWFPP